MKLYEINNQIEELLSQVYDIAESTEGEIPGYYSDILDKLNLDRDHKILDVARYVKSLNAESDAIKQESDKLYKRYKAIKNYSEHLKEYLKRNVNPGEKIKDNNTFLTWRKSEGVLITDENIVPENYYKIERKVQLSSIKRDIKNGFNIPGAKLEQRTNLQIK